MRISKIKQNQKTIEKKGYLLLRISRGNGDYLRFLIIPYKRAMMFKDWEIKNSKIVLKRGEIYLHLSVRKQFETKEHRNKLVIDINESSVDCLLYLNKEAIFFRIKHDLKELRLKYRDLRRKRQEKYENRAKLKFREKNRVNDRIKKITTLLAEIAKKFEADLVRENLKNLKENGRKISKDLNYRLNTFPYYKFIQNLDYKFYERVLEVHHVNPSKTSISCPMCGYASKKNRIDTRTFKCKKCGFEFDAQFNACLNLLIRLDDGNKPREILNVLRWVPSVVGTTAPREALIEIDDVLREKPVHVPIIPKILK